MDIPEVIARILLVVFVVWFFGKQFVLYRRFKKRGLYDEDRPSFLKELYYLHKGYRQAKKDFIRE